MVSVSPVAADSTSPLPALRRPRRRDVAVQRDVLDHRVAVLLGRVVAEVLEQAVGLGEVGGVGGGTPEQVADLHAAVNTESLLEVRERLPRRVRVAARQQRQAATAEHLRDRDEATTPTALLPGFSWERVSPHDTTLRWTGSKLARVVTRE